MLSHRWIRVCAAKPMLIIGLAAVMIDGLGVDPNMSSISFEDVPAGHFAFNWVLVSRLGFPHVPYLLVKSLSTFCGVELGKPSAARAALPVSPQAEVLKWRSRNWIGALRDQVS